MRKPAVNEYEFEALTVAIAPPNELVETPITDLLRETRLDGEGAVTQQVYRLLHGLIVNLRLLPNQFLSINDVGKILCISKTPIREAFIRLAEDGLVIIVPKKGTYVAPIDIQRAFEGYFIRASLEAACAELLAKQGVEHDFDALRGELRKQRKCLDAKDYDAFYILDNQFHDTMFKVAGLPTTKRLIDSAKAEVDRIKGLKSVYRFCRPEKVLYQEHTDLLDAIVGRDGLRARAEIKQHLTGMEEAIQAIAKEETLWGMVNEINQGARHEYNLSHGDMG